MPGTLVRRKDGGRGVQLPGDEVRWDPIRHDRRVVVGQRGRRNHCLGLKIDEKGYFWCKESKGTSIDTGTLFQDRLLDIYFCNVSGRSFSRINVRPNRIESPHG